MKIPTESVTAYRNITKRLILDSKYTEAKLTHVRTRSRSSRRFFSPTDNLIPFYKKFLSGIKN